MTLDETIQQIQDAVTKHSMGLDCLCYLFDDEEEDKLPLCEVVETPKEIIIYFHDWVGEVYSLTIEEILAQFACLDGSKNVSFVHRDKGNRLSLESIDDCLEDSIDFNAIPEEVSEIPTMLICTECGAKFFSNHECPPKYDPNLVAQWGSLPYDFVLRMSLDFVKALLTTRHLDLSKYPCDENFKEMSKLRDAIGVLDKTCTK